MSDEVSIVEIVVPQVGEAVSEVRIVEWFKSVGDPVEKGEPLFELDTDKAILQVEAFVSGRLIEVRAGAGSEVVPKQIVGLLAVDAPLPMATAQALAAAPHNEPAEVGPLDAARTVGARRATPRARRRAEELGVDIESIGASAPGRQLNAREIEQAAARPDLPDRAQRRREAIAQRTTANKQTIPHFYSYVDIDMSSAIKFRSATDPRPTFTDLIVYSCARVLVDEPRLNVQYSGQRVTARHSVDIGIVVALDEGMIVPVLRSAERLTPEQTSAAVQDLVQRSRNGRLRDYEVGSRAMSVSNLGMYGVDGFSAIVDQSESMILAVGRVADAAVPIGLNVEVRPRCTLTLSADHRVLDGVDAARFLAALRRRLEEVGG